VTLAAVGTCTIQATQAGNAGYAAATPVSQSLAVTQASQTITFQGYPLTAAFGGSPVLVGAIASSGLTVSFNSQTTAVCTVSGTTVTLAAVGTCTIQATQGGNANYAAATPVSQSFPVTPENQTITFGSLASQVFGTSPFAVSATASSGLAVGFSSQTTAVCTVSGTTVTLVGAGTCTIQATQSGNANYAAATPVSQGFTVTQASQTITFGTLASQAFGTSPFTVSATATSGLAVSFTSQTASVCAVSGTMVTLAAVGTCTIQATQTGNANYAAAAAVTQSFAVTPGSQSITFGALASQVFGTAPFTVSATATSGLAVTFASQTTSVCTVSGATVTLAAVGTCTLQATQAGNANYAAASAVSQSFSVTQASQTIAFGTLANEPMGTAPFTVSATASSGLAVSFASQTTSVCTVSGTTVTLAAVGTCTIQATQAGNANYAAATAVSQSFTVTAASQTITFGSLSNQPLGSAPFAASATASSGLAVSFSSLTTAVCTVSGTTVTLIAAGTCTIQATQTGNANYAAATPVSQGFTVTPAVLTVASNHIGNFTQGQQGAVYTVTVSNEPGAGATSGAVTVTDSLSSGLSMVSLAGMGWTCGANTCTRSDALSGGSSYPSVTVTVNVGAAATSPQVNTAAVSGGGSVAPPNANDATTVTVLPTLAPASGASVSVLLGGNTTFSLTATGYTGSSLALAMPGLPAGVTFAPSSIPATGGNVTVYISSGVQVGNYPLVITGSDGVASASVSPAMTLAIQDFTVVAAPAKQTLPCGPATFTYQVTAQGSNGYTGPVYLNYAFLPNVPPDVLTAPSIPFSIQANGVATSFTLTTSTPVGGAGCNPLPYEFQISGQLASLPGHFYPAEIDVGYASTQYPADFQPVVSPLSQMVSAGQAAAYQIEINPEYGFTDNSGVTIAVSTSGLCSNCSFLNPSSVLVPHSNEPGPSGLTVSVPSSAASGSYTLTITATSSSGISHSQNVTLTVQGQTMQTVTSVPTGLSLTIDGQTVCAQTPCQYNWSAGQQHTIQPNPAVQPATASGTQYSFDHWEDGTTGLAHTITVGAGSNAYTATFDTQYLVSASASPSAGGSVTMSPQGTAAQSGSWQNSGTQVTFSELPSSGYQFSGFTVAGVALSSNPLAITGPLSVTASFTLTQAPPSSPTLMSPVNAGPANNPPTLSWSAVSGATSYDVYLGASQPLPFVSNVAAGTGYTPGAPLASGVTYSWFVVARNGSSSSVPSPTWSFTPESGQQGAVPGPGQNVTPNTNPVVTFPPVSLPPSGAPSIGLGGNVVINQSNILSYPGAQVTPDGKSAILNVTNVTIDAGATVTVQGFDYLIFNASGVVQAQGAVVSDGPRVIFKSLGDQTIGASLMAVGMPGANGGNGGSVVMVNVYSASSGSGGNAGNGGDGGSTSPGAAGYTSQGGPGRPARLGAAPLVQGTSAPTERGPPARASPRRPAPVAPAPAVPAARWAAATAPRASPAEASSTTTSQTTCLPRPSRIRRGPR